MIFNSNLCPLFLPLATVEYHTSTNAQDIFVTVHLLVCKDLDESDPYTARDLGRRLGGEQRLDEWEKRGLGKRGLGCLGRAGSGASKNVEERLVRNYMRACEIPLEGMADPSEPVPWELVSSSSLSYCCWVSSSPVISFSSASATTIEWVPVMDEP